MQPFQTLVEQSPDAILIHDTSGKILLCNHAAAAMYARNRDAIVGSSIDELLLTDSAREYEGISLNREGANIPVSIRRSRIDYYGRTAVALYLRDSTETKRREEEGRKRLERDIQGAHKMEAVGRLAGGVAHDFNNLLTVITGRCEVLLGGLSKEHAARPDVLLIFEAAQRAASVTRQLLAFGRKQVLQPKILNLSAVIRGMDAMLRSLIKDNVKLVSELSGDLWSVEADRSQIEQVLMNLVVNALDAMPDGGVLKIHTSNVELETSPPGFGFDVKSGPYVMFSVQDSGSGIEPAILPRIFEPFFTTKDKTRGSGLGLPTVYGVVKQSGGYIVAASRPGEGATFKIYLPGLSEKPSIDETALRPSSATKGSETILVAEDSDLVRQLTREMLEVHGYRVLEASSGEQALTICKSYDGQIDLTLSDVVMPGLSGRELAERVAEVRPQMKVLLMSGYTDEITRADFLNPGMHFIEKPFTSNSLATKVREVLDQPTSNS